MKLSPGKAWSQQISVDKSYRGKGLAGVLRTEVFGELKKRGIYNFYGATLSTNVSSLKLAQKMGMNLIVDIHYSKLFYKLTWKYSRKSIPKVS